MWKMNPESLCAPFTFKLQTASASSEHCIRVVRTCGTDSSPLVELLVPWCDDDDDDSSVEKTMKLKPVCTSHLNCRVKSRGLFLFFCVYGNIVHDWLSTASFNVIHVLLCCYDSFLLFMAAFLLDNTVMYRKLTFTARNQSQVVVLLRLFWVVFVCKQASSSTNKENQSHLCDAMKRSDAVVCPDFFLIAVQLKCPPTPPVRPPQKSVKRFNIQLLLNKQN